MRVLILTKYAWTDSIASGNTLSNIFSGWKDCSFYTIYCRDSIPDNACCRHYLSISPTAILHNLLTPWKIGKRVEVRYDSSDSTCSDGLESGLKKLSHKHSVLFEIVYDALYNSKIWLNGRLKAYIKEANPDIVFSFGVPDAFNFHLITYLKKESRASIVTYFVDDYYKKTVLNPSVIIKKYRRRIHHLVNLSDHCYAITKAMCDEYESVFGRPFSLLMKGCYVRPEKRSVNHPLIITYAGNLLYGRAEVLAELVKDLQSIDLSDKNIRLNIYSSTALDNETRDKLTKIGVSTLFPPVAYSEILNIMSLSDIVLHIESFDEAQIEKVRLSFSTKIIDCLQSGSLVMAIGPEGIASIQFLKQVPGAVVVTDLSEIKKTIETVVSNEAVFLDSAYSTNQYARDLLSIESVRTRLKKDFEVQLNSNDRQRVI